MYYTTKVVKMLDITTNVVYNTITTNDALEGVGSEEMACNYREAFRAGVLLGMDIMGAFDEAE